MTLLEPAPVTAAGTAPTPGGTGSWRWQLRDKNGRWIQMGSEVSFSHNGKTITGIVVGSPKEGHATVRLANGSTVTVPTAGVTATGKNVSAPGAPSASKPTAPVDNVERPKPIKAVEPRLAAPGREGPSAHRKVSPAERRRNRKRAQAKRRRERARARRSRGSSSGSSQGSSSQGSSSSSSRGGSSNDNEMAAPDDRRLRATHRTSQSIESVIRARAKKKGEKDPFADEKESGGKSKAGGSKDGEGSGATKGGSEKGSSAGKRKSTKKKLTQSQIDAVAAIFKQVLKHVRAGEYQTALGQLDNAKAILKDTDAPWSLKRIHFLQKGLKAGLGYTASGALVARGGLSWDWQLRDRLGQWIDMHSEVRWLARGSTHTGHVVDSPGAGKAVVVEDATNERVTIPTSRLVGLGLLNEKGTATNVGNVSLEARIERSNFRAPPRTDAITASQYMALRTLRMDAIKAFGGSTSQGHAEEYGLARNNALIALDAAASKRVQTKAAVKKLSDARRQIAAARAWGDSEARRARLQTLEAQIQQAIQQLDPSAVATPKPAPTPKLKVSARWAEQSDILTAAGTSWQWQLRDKDGQWIKMGSRISWLSGGALHIGSLVGSPQEGIARVRSDKDGAEFDLPESRLTALPDVGLKVEYSSGDKTPKALIGEVIGRPEAGKVRVREIGTGREKTIPETTATVLSTEEFPPAIGDRKYITPPPPVGGRRIVEAKSSMAAHGVGAQEYINNDGGTLADPRHLRTNSKPKEGEPAAEMTASMSEIADHFTEVIQAAQAGVPYSDKANPMEMSAAPQWYERAHQVCLDLLGEYEGEIPGLTIEKVTGVMAAMSPRTAWEINIDNCKKILACEADPEFRKIPTAKAKSMTVAGNNTFVEDSLRILRDEGTPQEIMGGLKRRSFWNSMLDPKNDWDVCIDGWMASATRRIGLSYLDGTPLDKEGLKWLDDGKGQKQMEDSGAGYIITADATRIAAARTGLTPLQAQALYWVAVGGGAKNAKMWTDPPSDAYLAWRQDYLNLQASQREARLTKALLPMEVAS